MTPVQTYQDYLTEKARKDSKEACAESSIELSVAEVEELFHAAHAASKGKKNATLLTIESEAGHKLHIKLGDKK